MSIAPRVLLIGLPLGILLIGACAQRGPVRLVASKEASTNTLDSKLRGLSDSMRPVGAPPAAEVPQPYESRGELLAVLEDLRRTADDRIGLALSRVFDRARAYLRGYLEAPNIAVEMIAGALETGAATSRDPATIYRLMQRLAGLYDGISYLNVGVDDGNFFGLGRVDNVSRELLIEESLPANPGVLYQYIWFTMETCRKTSGW